LKPNSRRRTHENNHSRKPARSQSQRKEWND